MALALHFFGSKADLDITNREDSCWKRNPTTRKNNNFWNTSARPSSTQKADFNSRYE